MATEKDERYGFTYKSALFSKFMNQINFSKGTNPNQK